MRQLVHAFLAIILLFVQTGSVMAIAECCRDHSSTECHTPEFVQNGCHSDAPIPSGCCGSEEESCCDDEEDELVVIEPIHLNITTVKQQDHPAPQVAATSTSSFLIQPGDQMISGKPIHCIFKPPLSLVELQVFRC
jgi:hypothetical protein